MGTWQKGRADVDALLGSGRVEEVPANLPGAVGLVERARTHLRSAAALADDDVELAYDALHAANRKALTAVLLAQGLRPTREGGHTAVYDVVRAQLVPPSVRSRRRTRASAGCGTPVTTSTSCLRGRRTCERTSRTARRSSTPPRRSSAGCRRTGTPNRPRAQGPDASVGRTASTAGLRPDLGRRVSDLKPWHFVAVALVVLAVAAVAALVVVAVRAYRR